MIKGSHQTQEAIEKNRKAHTGKKDSLDTIRKKQESHTGEKNAFYGKKHTEETLQMLRSPKSDIARKHMSDSKKGKTPANIEILKKSRIGKTNSDFQKKRAQECLTGIVRSEETKQLISQNRTGKMMGADNHSWNGGTSYLPYCYKFNERRKKAVRNFFGNKCLLCTTTSTTNFVGADVKELSVHHIDHDKEQGCSGKPFNLVPLCFDCHIKELWDKENFTRKINEILDIGFTIETWSRETYERDVMYSE